MNPPKEQKEITIKEGNIRILFSPHTSPDSSNIKDGCKTPGAQAGFSSGERSPPQMFKNQSRDTFLRRLYLLKSALAIITSFSQL